MIFRIWNLLSVECLSAVFNNTTRDVVISLTEIVSIKVLCKLANIVDIEVLKTICTESDDEIASILTEATDEKRARLIATWKYSSYVWNRTIVDHSNKVNCISMSPGSNTFFAIG